MTLQQTNWAGNYTYRATQSHTPHTIEQLQELVRRSSRVKAIGTRHSFHGIADSPGELISLERLDQIVALDREHLTVTVEAGLRYGDLARWLHEQGYALHNLASLPHISVAGACATATHGSGDQHGNLATAITSMELVTASGELISLSGEQLRGAAVHLGGLGVVTRLTLQIAPTFQMQQDVYEQLALDELGKHFDEVTSSGYSVSLFTDWHEPTFNQVWVKRVTPEGTSLKADPRFFGARRATMHLHPIPLLSAEHCTEQLGICGPWFERMPHFRMGFTPSSGEELQSEYLVPRPHALEALQAIFSLRAELAPLLQISEIRTIAADDLWMSPIYRQDCVGIHCTWKKDWERVRALLPQIEHRLEPFAARPHWGKLFTLVPERVQSLYEKLPDFQEFLAHHDPTGKFRNLFLDTYIFGASAD